MFAMIRLQSLLLALSLAALIGAQSDGFGYQGYTRNSSGDAGSAIYETGSTPSNISTTDPPPDVLLNASVHVTEIFVEVSNITAKINLDAQVLRLLQFNAGVDASIDRVRLLIQDVNAEVTLVARLANLVLMVNNVLDSLDLNPILATLGQGIEDIADTAIDGLGGALGLGGNQSESGNNNNVRRSFTLENNILYSVNDYSGRTHTNRILAQNGNLIDQYLDNDGNIYDQKVVGHYSSDMTFNGEIDLPDVDEEPTREQEYVYTPFPGIQATCAVRVNTAGEVVSTQVISETNAGGTSSVGPA
ncbi:hypothetical protein BDY21DRAFT_368503 [Lineolata rhizophorae]|uniref:Uncharacterized protein n=1 Tax=Lineolata rhizophorae TaxID=578093 RepID=A0A6A6PGJ5_9PEZI|nr:hypothetical protein BDY21DRAFT_368503 [Lineolata rhizophorae]